MPSAAALQGERSRALARGWQEMGAGGGWGEGDGVHGELPFPREGWTLSLEHRFSCCFFAVACGAALPLPERCLTLLQSAVSLPCAQPLPRAGFSAPFFSVPSHLRSLQLCQAGC